MEIQITLEELRKKKLFVSTPMYGGMCAGMYTRSMIDLASFCTKHQIECQHHFLFNESLIPRARNYCCDEFMRSGYDYMLFLDADIGFNPQDVIAMMALQELHPEYDIIGGPYPKKCISWEKIKHAVDKGFADKDPNVLERFVGDFVFNPKGGQQQIPIGEPVEVLEIGTGFMMISRSAMERFQAAYPQYMYKPDHVRTEHFDGSREIMQFFQAEIDRYTPEEDMRNLLLAVKNSPENAANLLEAGMAEIEEKTKSGAGKSKRYLSEDYWFCQKAHDAGIRTWFCPWMRTQHVGTYIFGGSLADLAAIQAPATADAEALKKNREKAKK
jgi:hypothetical protein